MRKKDNVDALFQFDTTRRDGFRNYNSSERDQRQRQCRRGAVGECQNPLLHGLHRPWLRYPRPVEQERALRRPAADRDRADRGRRRCDQSGSQRRSRQAAARGQPIPGRQPHHRDGRCASDRHRLGLHLHRRHVQIPDFVGRPHHAGRRFHRPDPIRLQPGQRAAAAVRDHRAIHRGLGRSRLFPQSERSDRRAVRRQPAERADAVALRRSQRPGLAAVRPIAGDFLCLCDAGQRRCLRFRAAADDRL